MGASCAYNGDSKCGFGPPRLPTVDRTHTQKKGVTNSSKQNVFPEEKEEKKERKSETEYAVLCCCTLGQRGKAAFAGRELTYGRYRSSAIARDRSHVRQNLAVRITRVITD